MNFAAINASIAWHEASRRREVSPVIRKLREIKPAASTNGTYVKNGITLPYVSILAQRAGEQR